MQDWYDYFQELFRLSIKFVAHVLTGICEIERICGQGWHKYEMSQIFESSLLKSKKLSSISHSMLDTDVVQMDVQPHEHIRDEIVQKKHIDPAHQLAIINISYCVEHILYATAVLRALKTIQHTSFNESFVDHRDQLDTLWSVFKPDTKRQGGMVTSEWGELGFQGNNPATDFRGMGMLGLLQLIYFGQNDNMVARQVLSESIGPIYFPFAAVGINITSLVMQLAEERRLDGLLFNRVDTYRMEKGLIPIYNNPQLIEKGCDVIHSIYAETFVSFHQLWLRRKPQDIMGFPAVFQELKTITMAKYANPRDQLYVYWNDSTV